MKKKILVVFLSLFFSNKYFAQNHEWFRQMGGTGADKGSLVTTDVSGNIYTLSTFEESPDFNVESGNITLSAKGETDILITKNDENGNLLWVKSIGGLGADEGYSIFTDNEYLYITGTFENTADFNPNNNDSYMLTSNGFRDIFILKLDKNGSFIWAKNIGSGSNDYGVDITADNEGNVYTTGYFGDQADFNPGSENHDLVALSWDIFVSKLDADGNFVWAKKFGGGSEDKGNSIKLDESGNIYVTGTYTSYFTDYTGDLTDYILGISKQGFEDTFVLKLNNDGNTMWARQIGGGNYNSRQSILLDDIGNIYAVGSFENTADFDPGEGIFEMTSTGGKDVFVTKLNQNGDFVWAKQFGGTEDDHSYSIQSDSEGNLYISGDFMVIANFDPDISTQYNLTSNGKSDVFLTKIDAGGNFIWAKQFGGTGADYGNYISIDKSKNIIITGSFEEDVDFNTEGSSALTSSKGKSDIFLLKLNQKDITTSTFISEEYLHQGIKVFPNPSKGKINLELEEGYNTMIIRDVNGQIVQKQSFDNFGTKEIYILGKPGIYMLEISNDAGNSKTFRILKK